MLLFLVRRKKQDTNYDYSTKGSRNKPHHDGTFMKKIILWTFAIVVLNISHAIAEVTFSAFTEEGRVLHDEFSIVDKNENFRIIFFTDEKSEYNLVLKTNKKILKSYKITKIKKIYIPRGEAWLNLEKLDGGIENLTVLLTNSETNIKLNYAAVEFNFKTEINNKNIKYIGEEEIIDFVSYPELENLQIEDKTVTLRSNRVRGLAHNEICDFERSVVRIKTSKTTGTGFIIEKNKIITNWHVVKYDRWQKIFLKAEGYNKVSYRHPLMAYVEYEDEKRDLAILKVIGNINKSPLSLADNETVKKGDTVHTIGHPHDSNWSCSNGSITNIIPYSWKDPVDRSKHILKVSYQTDISIDKGNSGGPLFDSKAKVIGVVTAFHPKNKLMNYSSSLDEVKNFLANYKNSHLHELKNLSQTKKVSSRPFDNDNDGIPDGEDIDSDNDGIFETRKIKTDKVTVISKYKNGDWTPVFMKVIKNIFQGIMETAIIYLDTDWDGDWDKKYIDRNNDGNPEDAIKL